MNFLASILDAYIGFYVLFKGAGQAKIYVESNMVEAFEVEEYLTNHCIKAETWPFSHFDQPLYQS